MSGCGQRMELGDDDLADFTWSGGIAPVVQDLDDLDVVIQVEHAALDRTLERQRARARPRHTGRAAEPERALGQIAAAIAQRHGRAEDDRGTDIVDAELEQPLGDDLEADGVAAEGVRAKLAQDGDLTVDVVEARQVPDRGKQAETAKQHGRSALGHRLPVLTFTWRSKMPWPNAPSARRQTPETSAWSRAFRYTRRGSPVDPDVVTGESPSGASVIRFARPAAWSWALSSSGSSASVASDSSPGVMPTWANRSR